MAVEVNIDIHADTRETARHESLVDSLPIKRFLAERDYKVAQTSLALITAEPDTPYQYIQMVNGEIDSSIDRMRMVDVMLPLLINRARSLGKPILEHTVDTVRELEVLLEVTRISNDWSLNGS
jgi:hypothetical protein